MPQIVIEVPNGLEFNTDKSDLLKKVNYAVSESGNIPVANCKSRIYTHNHWYVGGDDSQFCINTTVEVLDGKSNAEKKAIAVAVAGVIKENYKSGNKETQITVHVSDLIKEIYTKEIV